MSKAVKTLFALAILGAAALFAIFAVDRSADIPTVEPTNGDAGAVSSRETAPRGLGQLARYADETQCAECHPGESALHSRSGHSATLRPSSSIRGLEAWMSKPFPDPDRPSATWRLEKSERGLEFVRELDGKVRRDRLQFGFGSGHHGLTFVTLDKETDPGYPTGIEHRLSYFKNAEGFTITPGQEKNSRLPGRTEHGRALDYAEVKKCFGCHSTLLSDRGANRVDVDQMIPNVACQSCHGPAAAHVAAARSADESDGLRFPPFGFERAKASDELEACGQCHRHPSQFRPTELVKENLSLIRFQPVGIMMSRCFRSSGQALQCSSCHDPHARVSRDTAAYEQVCASCHQPQANQTVCRASVPPPSEGCVHCHMPKGDAGQQIFFTDHWIQVPKSQPKPPAVERK